jgi:ketosteroid isomerase-like protein
MSTNFVDRVRASYAAFARGDIDFLLAHADPEIEIVGPGGKTYHGHDGLIEYVHRCDRHEAEAEAERFIDGGRERVIVIVPPRGVDLHTGRNGKCIRLEVFGELDEAFAAIGLRKLKGER